jgi:hypothetical protein
VTALADLAIARPPAGQEQPIKILTATSRTQGRRASDFHWCIDGEVVTPVRVICDRERELGPDGGCGCGRSFVGLSSHKGTTTAMVREISGYTLEDLTEAVRSYLQQAGWDDGQAEAEAALIAETAAGHDAGTILAEALGWQPAAAAASAG